MLLCKRRPSFRNNSPPSSSRVKSGSGVELPSSSTRPGISSEWKNDSAWSLRDRSTSTIHVNPLMEQTGGASQVGATPRADTVSPASVVRQGLPGSNLLPRVALRQAQGHPSDGDTTPGPSSGSAADESAPLQGIRRDSVLDWVRDSSDDDEDEEDGAIPNLLEERSTGGSLGQPGAPPR